MKGGLLLNKIFKGMGFYLLIFVIIVAIVHITGKPADKVKQMKFSEVYRELDKENIKNINFINGTAVEGTIKDTNTKFR